MNTQRIATVLVATALTLNFAVPRVARANTVGKSASDFTLQTHDGKKFTLSKLKGQRGAVLVFFATWCPACMAEVPKVKKFVNVSKGKDVLVYGVNIEQPQRIVDRFVKEHKVNYRILLDRDGKASRAYGITGIPTVIGIDADGVVRYRAHAMPRDAKAFIRTMVAPLTRNKEKEKAEPQASGQNKETNDRDYVRDDVRFISKETLVRWTAGAEKPLIIDVLPPQSYNRVHIKGATNIPLAELRDRSAELDKDRKIVVYCASYQCHASTEAAKLLNSLGFKDVSDYKGGIKEWTEAGLTVAGS